MGDHKSELDRSEDKGDSKQYIYLEKDKKPICQTECLNPPYKLPDRWNCEEIVRKSKINIPSGLPQFSLCPATENQRDLMEWERFLNHLQNFDKVAIAKFELYKFYILPPNEVTAYSQVRVAYWVGEASNLDDRSRDCESSSHLVECTGGSDAPKIGRVPETGEYNHSPCKFSQPRVVKQEPLQKNYAQTDPSYLKTLAHNHSGWIFGGIAELVDNSRDAKATKVDIFIDMIYSKRAGKDIPMLSVIDDGLGMNHREVVKMVCFGHKQPDGDDPDRIGRFGIGFKSGAMRLGRDVLVLTQTANSRSIAFLSQSLNDGKDNVEIPIVSYRRQGQFMEVDTSVQSEVLAKYNLKAIQEFSPFNKYLIGEKAGLFCDHTGTHIFIWNLDEWGSNYYLEWHNGLNGGSSFHHGDILIRSRRIRSRPGQISQQVPLDYSLRSYLEVIFLVPRMKIYVQGSLVRSRPLATSLTKTVVETGIIMEKLAKLTLGFCQLEWEHANCGIFLYWHGRLIEAYKRVGGMGHNGDVGRGVIGVVDVTDLMNDGNGRVWVHNNKQGFQDCEQYLLLEKWLGRKADEYWDSNFDSLKLKKYNCLYKPDQEWVQCDKCRKWRMLSSGFDSTTLPMEWFCYMEPFKGSCRTPEQKAEPGVIIVSAKRSGYDCEQMYNCKYMMDVTNASDASEGNEDDKVADTAEDVRPPVLKRLRKGPIRACKQAS
ncbi:CW-type zinc finger protein [Quillaja saponaria]|uniref:CW-type zinc finger protein n=1 Tax=Quillaja saponaria TaxID=32244 RepID=A0AAD7P6H1_QUISA|nr:CW-type zinc finger protein [Quillaja saponaria]